jgi:hypothetical protein
MEIGSQWMAIFLCHESCLIQCNVLAITSHVGEKPMDFADHFYPTADDWFKSVVINFHYLIFALFPWLFMGDATHVGNWPVVPSSLLQLNAAELKIIHQP